MDHGGYLAFLSYGHRDKRWASWLHRALEGYRVPSKLVGQDSPVGPIPAKMRPIFRDRDELAASADLSARIEEALAQTRSLVVLCSPAAANSRWTNEEIATFKRLHPDRPILAAIVSGEPYASEMPGREEEECFPPALRFQLEPDGTLSDRRAEPIAADFRAEGDGKRLGKLKLIAGILGVRLDDLVQRDTARRNRNLAIVAAASVVGMVGTSALAIFAFDQRNEAREQRAEADGLIEYMLTDLRAQLEPVGRLEVLDGVGKRALDYYARQKLADLTDGELGRRARATQLVAEVQNLRGNNEVALPAFRQSARTTAAILARNPDDPQAIFDHSQSQFWVGYLAWQADDLDEATERFEDYRRLAERLVAIDPANETWVAELGYANTNLGVIALEQEEPSSAIRYFKNAEMTWRQLGGGKPSAPRETTYHLAQSLAWQADANRRLGLLDTALELRMEETRIYENLGARAGDFEAMEGLLVSLDSTTRILLDAGKVSEGLSAAHDATEVASRLRSHDRANVFWQAAAAKAEITLAEALILSGALGPAHERNSAALQECQRLLRSDSDVAEWRKDCFGSALPLQVILEKLRGRDDRSAELAQQFRREFERDIVAADRGILVSAALIQASASDRLIDDRQLIEFRDARLSALATRAGIKHKKTGAYPIHLLLRE